MSSVRSVSSLRFGSVPTCFPAIVIFTEIWDHLEAMWLKRSFLRWITIMTTNPRMFSPNESFLLDHWPITSMRFGCVLVLLIIDRYWNWGTSLGQTSEKIIFPVGNDHDLLPHECFHLNNFFCQVNIFHYSAPNNHLTTQVTERSTQGHIYC